MTRRAQWLAVGLIVLVATVLYAWFALRVRAIQPDEGLHLGLARWLPGDLPGSAFELEPYVRGLQRLYVFVIAIPLGLFDSPTDWEITRILDCLLFASAAIPAFKLARELRAAPVPALWVAALSAILPIGIVATAFLTENLAYPLCTWTLWAIWRSALAPSVGRDGVAVALIALTTLTRVNFAALGAAYVIVAVVQTWRFGQGPGRLPARVVRGFPVLTALVAAGVLAFVLSAAGAIDLGALIADRTPKETGGIGEILSRIVQRLTRTAVATGIAPAVLALPWVLRTVVRPGADAARHALAWVALTAGGATVISAAGASFDERYTVYLAPIILIAAVLALTDPRRLPAWSLIAAGGLLGLTIGATDWNPDRTGLYSAFTYPAETAWARLVDGPLGGGAVAVVVCILGGLALGAVLAGAFPRPSWQRALALATAALVLAMTISVLTRFDDGVGGRFMGGDLAFLDRFVGPDDRSGIIVATAGSLDPLLQRLDNERGFNGTARTIVSLEQPFSFGPPPGVRFVLAETDDATGEVINGDALPSTLAVPRDYVRLGLAGDIVARSALMNYDTLRLQRPARARFRVDGAMADGFLAPDGTGRSHATVKVWVDGLQAGECLTIPFLVPGDGGVPRTITVRPPGARAQQLRLEQGAGGELTVPLQVGAARAGVLDVPIEIEGYGTTNDLVLAARLGALRVLPCG